MKTRKKTQLKSVDDFIKAGETPIEEKNYIEDLKRDKLVQVNIPINEKLRTDIKAYCVRHHIRMKDLLQELVTKEMERRLEMEGE